MNEAAQQLVQELPFAIGIPVTLSAQQFAEGLPPIGIPVSLSTLNVGEDFV